MNNPETATPSGLGTARKGDQKRDESMPNVTHNLQSATDSRSLLKAPLTEYAPDPSAAPFDVEKFDREEAQRHRAEALNMLPVIVRADGRYYLRAPDSADYAISLDSTEALRIEFLRRYRQHYDLTEVRNGKAVMRGTDELLLTYAQNALTIVRDFAASETHFDPSTQTLIHGYRMSALTACESEGVAEWLTALSGGHLDGLYDWIASTAQKWIARPATALVIAGKPNIGKSLFANALAMTWGQNIAVPMSDATARFNGRVADCPVWFGDEEIPRDLSTNKFRELVQRRQHDIEKKGQEKFTLRGACRAMFAVNELADFNLGGISGPDAVQAVSDRLSILQPLPNTRAALDALRSSETEDLDLNRIVRHLLWVQQTHEPMSTGVRFLGKEAGTGNASELALQGAIRACPAVFEFIREYAVSFGSIERSYGLEGGFTQPGNCFPIVVKGGVLYARPVEIAARLKLPAHELGNVQRALHPFRAEACDRTMRVSTALVKEYRGKFWALNVDALARSLKIELAYAMGTDTADLDRQGYWTLIAPSLEFESPPSPAVTTASP